MPYVLVNIWPIYLFAFWKHKFICVSWKIFQVSRFSTKSSDSQKNFVFLQKQTFLELTPPV